MPIPHPQTSVSSLKEPQSYRRPKAPKARQALPLNPTQETQKITLIGPASVT